MSYINGLYFSLVQIVHFRTWKLYEVPEEKKWKLRTRYNAIVLMKIIMGCPGWVDYLIIASIIN
jgi:hypothetical protein